MKGDKGKLCSTGVFICSPFTELGATHWRVEVKEEVWARVKGHVLRMKGFSRRLTLKCNLCFWSRLRGGGGWRSEDWSGVENEGVAF